MKSKNRHQQFRLRYLTNGYIAVHVILLCFAILFALQRLEIPPFDRYYIYYLRFVSPPFLVCNLIPSSFVAFFLILVVIFQRTWGLFWAFILHIVVSVIILCGSFPGFLGGFEEISTAEIRHHNSRYILTNTYPSLGIGGVNRVYHIVHECDQFRFICNQLYIESYRIRIGLDEPDSATLISSDDVLQLQINGVTVFTYPLAD